MGFFTKDIKSLNDLFMHGLQDLYYAENQIMKALPGMIEKATDAQLRAGFEKHLAETEGQVHRLRQVFELLESEQLATDLAKGGRRPSAPATDQLGLFAAPPHPVIEKLKEIDVDGLTPLYASQRNQRKNRQ